MNAEAVRTNEVNLLRHSIVEEKKSQSSPKKE